jgi:hypothetical protein
MKRVIMQELQKLQTDSWTLRQCLLSQCTGHKAVTLTANAEVERGAEVVIDIYRMIQNELTLSEIYYSVTGAPWWWKCV